MRAFTLSAAFVVSARTCLAAGDITNPGPCSFNVTGGSVSGSSINCPPPPICFPFNGRRECIEGNGTGRRSNLTGKMIIFGSRSECHGNPGNKTIVKSPIHTAFSIYVAKNDNVYLFYSDGDKGGVRAKINGGEQIGFTERVLSSTVHGQSVDDTSRVPVKVKADFDGRQLAFRYSFDFTNRWRDGSISTMRRYFEVRLSTKDGTSCNVLEESALNESLYVSGAIGISVSCGPEVFDEQCQISEESPGQ
jgi:hypothetical protein